MKRVPRCRCSWVRIGGYALHLVGRSASDCAFWSDKQIRRAIAVISFMLRAIRYPCGFVVVVCRL